MLDEDQQLPLTEQRRMKLPSNALIAKAKLTRCIFWSGCQRTTNQRSWRLLATLRKFRNSLKPTFAASFLPIEAQFVETTEYGDKYRIRGQLTGPNGRTLKVESIWMTEHATNVTKFVTLYPAQEV